MFKNIKYILLGLFLKRLLILRYLKNLNTNNKMIVFFD